MSKRIYVAGPMRGYSDFNYPAFHAATARFRALGWVVVNPAEVGALFAHSPDVHGSEYIREDLLHLARCQAIAPLPGWEKSTGARCEVAVAITLGLAFFDSSTGEPATAPARVTISGGYECGPGSVDTLDALREECIAWANATFRAANQTSKAAHLEREAAELRAAPHDVEEMADVAILLFHLSDGHDLVNAIRAKLTKNQARTWGTPDAEGVVEHERASP